GGVSRETVAGLAAALRGQGDSAGRSRLSRRMGRPIAPWAFSPAPACVTPRCQSLVDSDGAHNGSAAALGGEHSLPRVRAMCRHPRSDVLRAVRCHPRSAAESALLVRGAHLGPELEHCGEPAFRVKRRRARRPSGSALTRRTRAALGAIRALHHPLGIPHRFDARQDGCQAGTPPLLRHPSPAHQATRVPEPPSTANTRRTKATRVPGARSTTPRQPPVRRRQDGRQTGTPPPRRHPQRFDAGQDGCRTRAPPPSRHPHRFDAKQDECQTRAPPPIWHPRG
ncbi:MAG: hypothetical protein K0R30_2303, partial [Ornithinibacter sp.]|nr:hypothetical protein [Ornithinibacter sp.]